MDWSKRLPRIRAAAVWAVVGFVAVYAVIGVLVDGGRLGGHALPELRHPWLLLLVFTLAPANYGLRFIKWHAYTRRLGFSQVPWRGNLVVFVSGLGLTVTPGKVGELVKSWMLWDRYEVPAARSAPMIFADRVTDGCAMLALASLGALWLGRGQPPYLLMAAIVVLILLVRSRTVMLAAVRLLSRLRPLRGMQARLHDLVDAARTLLALDMFLLAFGLGVVGWGLEGLIVALVLRAFAFPFSIGGSLLVVASSAIAGGVSALPGGVGAAEGVMVALLLWLRVPLPLAVLATLITRVSTLWLGVAIGLVCLGVAEGRRPVRGAMRHEPAPG